MSKLLKIAAQETPGRKRRSELDPYLADLQKLKADGYTAVQLVSFLEKLGIKITRQALHNFLKSRESKETQK